MEGKDLTDNIIRNIVSEIMRECKNRHIRESANFVSYYVRLLQLDPNRQLTFQHLTEREKIQSFVQYLVHQLEKKKDPKVLTLKLQHEFRIHIRKLDDNVQQCRRELQNRLYPLLLDIIEQDKKHSRDQLYRKICNYAILKSGLGNPSKRPVFKEVLQVLKSILNENEIDTFPSLQNYIKQELVSCLVDIITGIRLYNKWCKKGGEGMADLPGLMEKAINAVRTQLNDCVELTLHRDEILTRSIEKNIIVNKTDGEWEVTLSFSSKQEKMYWEFRRDFATALKQLGKTTGVLLESIAQLDTHRTELNDLFEQTVQSLNKIIIPTLYQAVTEVFPHFTQLATIWKEFQDDSLRLREILNIFKLQTEQIFSLPFDETLIPEPSLSMEYENDKIEFENNNPDILVHHNTDDFTVEDLEFHGYCCWMLTNADGVLMPAKVDLGVFEYKHKFYGFSSKIAANSFCEKPEFYIMNSLVMARKWVHLIKLLNLEQELKEKIDVKVLIELKEEPKIAVCSQGVQTDTHFEESKTDYNYCWNVWRYKRTILKCIDVMNKRTVFCETDKLQQQESNHTQTYEMINSTTQTDTDHYANTRKPSRFVHGLRGIRNNYPFVMDLTEPVDCSQVPK